ncbi:thiamine phosphate synthase [Pelagibacterales bacterium SAG-MED14]|nr:thiamine phosphate synthase [Pelagibacterales bacterium SAG-MED14]
MHDYIQQKYYFISKLDKNLINQQDKKTTIIYRNYTSKKIDEKLILKFKNLCKKNGNKFVLSNNIKLAMKLNLDGVYIPAFNKNTNHLSYSFKKRFSILGSAHNYKEIRIKEKQHVQEIFLSSIFKKNKNFLGINKFKNLTKQTSKIVIALGGISNNNFKKLKLTHCKGFAGISFFE